MKRFFMTLAVAALAAGSAMAQGNPASLTKAVADAKAKIAKSDSEIQDAKKGGSYKTWDSRGRAFYEAYNAPIKDITMGLPTNAEKNPLYNIEYFVGAPSEKKQDGDFEIWVYPTCNVYVQNEVVQFAVATDQAAEKPLESSIEAFRKAAALDAKGSYRTNEKTLLAVQDVKKALFNEGGNSYLIKDYAKAAYYFEMCANITDFDAPKLPDTSFSLGQCYFNAALSAFHAKDYDKSRSLWDKSIENKYQIGTCYQYIFEIMKTKGQIDEGIKLIKNAYEKNTNENQILYTLIDAYAGDKKYDEAIEYLDKAIADDPSKAIFYYVKGNMYKGKSQQFKNDYIEKENGILSLKKEAYRARTNATELANVNARKDEAVKNAQLVKSKFMDNQDKALSNYSLAIEKDPTLCDAYLLKAELYRFDQLEVAEAENNIIQPSEANSKELSDAKEKEIKDICKKAAEIYEKAYQVKEDTFPLQHLKSLYYRLEDTGNYNRVKALLEK